MDCRYVYFCIYKQVIYFYAKSKLQKKKMTSNY